MGSSQEISFAESLSFALVVLTGVLVLLTGLYAFLTWRMAVEAKNSAASSRAAAEAAKEAAQAADRSANAAEAQLPIDFGIKTSRYRDGSFWFNLVPSVNLFIHRANIKGLILINPEGVEVNPVEASLRPPHAAPFELPRFVHTNEEFSMEWGNPTCRRSDYGMFGYVAIEYSLTEDGARRVKCTNFDTPDDAGHTYQAARHLIQARRNENLTDDGPTLKDEGGK